MPPARWRCFDYEELKKRDKLNLDIFWIRDESLEESDNLPDPDVIALEIADDLEAALEQFREIVNGLGEYARAAGDAVTLRRAVSIGGSQMSDQKRICPDCGDDVLDTDTTCMSCGAPLKVAKKPAPGSAKGARPLSDLKLDASDKRLLIWGGVVIFVVFELLAFAGSASENANALWVVLSGLAWMVLLVWGIVFEVQQAQEQRAATDAQYMAAREKNPELTRHEWDQERLAEALERTLRERKLSPNVYRGHDQHMHLAWFNTKARKAGVPERFTLGDAEKPSYSQGPNIGGALVGGMMAGAPGMVVGGLSKKREPFGFNWHIVKECPECREHVKVRAKVCRFCSYSFQGDVDAWLAEFH